MKYILSIFLISAIWSCQLPSIYNPHWDDSDWVEQPIDTIPVDTIPVEIVDTCTSYTEYTTPAFVGLYVKFDEPQDSILWEGGGISSYNLGEVVSHITNLPFEYGTSPIGAWVVIEGTNNHQQFQLKIFTRTFNEAIYRGVDPMLLGIPNLIPSAVSNGKWYFGTGRQTLIVPGVDEPTYIHLINKFPSFDMFSFYGVTLDSIPEVNVLRETLKDCHGGRWYADLYFLLHEHEPALIDSFGVGYADWERVRTH